MQSRVGKHFELWGELDNSIWLSIADLGREITFKAGYIIPYKEYKGLFYIKKGKVMLSYLSNKGKEIKALYYFENSIFNEARTFSSLDPTCKFQCIEDCKLIFFPRSLFKPDSFLQEHPQIAKNLLTNMADKILLHYHALTGLRANNDLVNVSRFILQLYLDNGCKKSCEISYNQQDIADILGVHRTTIARSIRALKDVGALLSLSRYSLVIGDLDALQEIAEEGKNSPS